MWGALGSALVEAELLKHAGYTDVYQWSDSALKRALDWLHTIDQFPAQADDGYAPWIANAAYGTSYPAPARTNGKAIGWTSWTHAKSGTTTTTTTSGTTTTTSGTTTATSGTTTTTSGTTTTTTTTTSPLTGGAKTTSFAASADAQVNSAKPTNNYGALTTLRAKTSSTSDGAVYRSYLTFTVTAISGPPSAVKLRLYVTDASDNGGLIYPVANGWNESTISWANAPQLPATSIGQATAQTAETGPRSTSPASSPQTAPTVSPRQSQRQQRLLRKPGKRQPPTAHRHQLIPTPPWRAAVANRPPRHRGLRC